MARTNNMQNVNEPKRKHHVVARIVCLLLAFVIWFVVAGVNGDNYKREIDGVKVVLVGEDSLENYQVTSYPKTVKVTIKGDHSKVMDVSPEDLTVTVDVSAINASGSLKVPAAVQFSAKLEGITAYGEYTVDILVNTVKHNDVGSGS